MIPPEWGHRERRLAIIREEELREERDEALTQLQALKQETPVTPKDCTPYCHTTHQTDCPNYPTGTTDDF